jgi:hypothetical protein
MLSYEQLARPSTSAHHKTELAPDLMMSRSKTFVSYSHNIHVWSGSNTTQRHLVESGPNICTPRLELPQTDRRRHKRISFVKLRRRFFRYAKQTFRRRLAPSNAANRTGSFQNQNVAQFFCYGAPTIEYCINGPYQATYSPIARQERRQEG